MSSEVQPTEVSPLIQAGGSDTLSNCNQDQSPEHDVSLWTKDVIRIAGLAAAFLIFYAFADVLKYISTVRLIELGICREINPSLIDKDGKIPEHLCKSPEIQQRLAHLRGFLGALDAIIGLLLTLPYGMIVDRIGERTLAGINTFGYLLSCAWILTVCYFWSIFPIWTVVLAPLLRIIGGGSPILSSVIYSVAAKHVPDASRSLCFFLFMAGQLLTEIVAIVSAASLLDHGFLYTPLILNLPIGLLCLVTLFLLPPSKYLDKMSDGGTVREGQTDKTIASARHSIHILSRLLKDRNILVLLATIPIAKLVNPVTELMLQYIPRKFELSLASASRVLSIQAVESLILLAVILPILKSVAQLRYKVMPTKVDLFFVQSGFLIMSVGSLFMAISQTLAIFILGLLVFTFGCSTRPALQSVLTDLVSREHIAVLYTVIAVGDGLGTAGGALILNQSLATAIKWDEKLYLGLPFVIGAICYICGFGGSLFAGFVGQDTSQKK